MNQMHQRSTPPWEPPAPHLITVPYRQETRPPSQVRAETHIQAHHVVQLMRQLYHPTQEVSTLLNDTTGMLKLPNDGQQLPLGAGLPNLPSSDLTPEPLQLGLRLTQRHRNRVNLNANYLKPIRKPCLIPSTR